MKVYGTLLEFKTDDFLHSKLATSSKDSVIHQHETETDVKDTSASYSNVEKNALSGLTCQICGIGSNSTQGFDSVFEQREHFKSDWHRYNLQCVQKQRTILTWDQFESKIENDEVSSISGSDSDSESGDLIDSNVVNKERNKNETMATLVSENGVYYRIWSCLLISPQEELEDHHLETEFHHLTDMYKWCVILAKGGHFAFVIFEKSSPEEQVKTKAHFKVIVHKTLHRYVVRAKSGGRQSTKDASGKYAKSAGATLRRYNEAALEKDIQHILKSWKEELAACYFIFVSASNADKNALFGGTNPCLNYKDPRIRQVPFLTRRPTFSETKRVSNRLWATFNVSPSASNDLGQLNVHTHQCEADEKHIPDVVEKFSVDTHQIEPTDSKESNEVDPRIPSKKKKNKRRSKIKDQRRKNSATKQEDEDQQELLIESKSDNDDEVERAIAEATEEFNRLKSKQTKKQHTQKKGNLDERRSVLREAAEKRIAALQNTSKRQALW